MRVPLRHLALAAGVLALAAAALAAGRNWLPPGALWAALGDPEGAGRMVWSLRLPRLLLGLFAGAALGLAGLTFQTLLRNPLASPDIIGVTQSAAFGAVAAMLAGGSTVLGAWAGGLCGMALIGALAWDRRSGLSSRAVVLQGLGLAIFASAGTEAMILRANDGAAGMAMTWLTGTLNGAGWAEIGQAARILPLMVPLLLAGRLLDRLEFTDDLARALGLRVAASRIALALLAALVAAGAVSLAGPLGFVALASGPLSRRLAGGRPAPVAAALIGAGFVTLADLLARAISPATFLPTGLYTALIGAPILLIVLAGEFRRNRS
ncbi:iron ABC transporter permease [Paracoccus aminophilus]|uniref:Siderophore ABC transporter transmembrane protein n=1 Tax=Paracoccus aminophilus JCM 7686 TaxID=1367847 RepID=S5XZN3_PARAH|nr:iron ABC transporter permease [Paracoccus aminophilus]AGT10752.1 siderophore ABC transporter transmembrane protein [Paracoccus aminophilus JCM 7686]